ncbi:hypothetical protein PIB30_029962 [Stylosanthes scabra]|uniref:Uncharacterized protein n=1 Tax=Stylosanthes scabra TaxID=79078 RepID=A0ABU6X908_9FABA|nr:hypothetical protein [Stylosanthes scabra]
MLIYSTTLVSKTHSQNAPGLRLLTQLGAIHVEAWKRESPSMPKAPTPKNTILQKSISRKAPLKRITSNSCLPPSLSACVPATSLTPLSRRDSAVLFSGDSGTSLLRGHLRTTAAELSIPLLRRQLKSTAAGYLSGVICVK